MLPSPTYRRVSSLTCSSIAAIFRHLPGVRKGMAPSMTNIKQKATASSCHMVLIIRVQAIRRLGDSK